MEMDKVLDITQEIIHEFSKMVADKLLSMDQEDHPAAMRAVMAATAYLHIMSMQVAGIPRDLAKEAFSSAVDAQYDEEDMP
jgi:hypothetical protein